MVFMFFFVLAISVEVLAQFLESTQLRFSLCVSGPLLQLDLKSLRDFFEKMDTTQAQAGCCQQSLGPWKLGRTGPPNPQGEASRVHQANAMWKKGPTRKGGACGPGPLGRRLNRGILAVIFPALPLMPHSSVSSFMTLEPSAIIHGE